MNTNIENPSEELSGYENNILLPVMITGLQLMIGKKMAFSNKQCCDKLKKLGHEVDDPRFRKMIQHIFKNNLVPGLIASEKGYYVTKDPKELEIYLNSLKERRNLISQRITALEIDLQFLTNTKTNEKV